MDFTFSDEQQAIATSPTGSSPSSSRRSACASSSRTASWFADDVWAELAKADLLGIALPEADGGGGYGLLEACLIAEQVGRTVAPVPYLSCIVGAALALAGYGDDEQRAGCCPASSPAPPCSRWPCTRPATSRCPPSPTQAGPTRRRLAPRRRRRLRRGRRPCGRDPAAGPHRRGPQHRLPGRPPR